MPNQSDLYTRSDLYTFIAVDADDRYSAPREDDHYGPLYEDIDECCDDARAACGSTFLLAEVARKHKPSFEALTGKRADVWWMCQRSQRVFSP